MQIFWTKTSIFPQNNFSTLQIKCSIRALSPKFLTIISFHLTAPLNGADVALKKRKAEIK